MLFNSLAFLIFLPLVFIIYWLVIPENKQWRNFFILTASYVFYGWWDWRFLFLIIISSLTDFIIGQFIYDTSNKKRKKLYLLLSLIVNLGILGTFKYYDFFISSFTNLIEQFGFNSNLPLLNIILPAGISFYTFQTLSYTIDIYREKVKPTREFLTFFAYVSFFPQLVAGPIERASHLIPQFQKTIPFNYPYAVDGAQRMLWGFFKKIVIADTCAIPVNYIFSNHASFEGDVLILGAFLFAFQIYCDFSGYSDIAIGLARLFGIDIMENFKKPYFARNIMEFWKRWHKSLSSWFKDYVYIPLGGNRLGFSRQIFNMMAVFLLSGLWHGANWTFVIWGFIHGLFYIPSLFIKNRDDKKQLLDSPFPDLRTFFMVVFNFLVVVLAWVFFRAENLSHAIGYLSSVFNHFRMITPFTVTRIHGLELEVVESILSIVSLVIIEFFTFKYAQPFRALKYKNRTIRWGSYVLVIMVIFLFGAFNKNKFIYFQF